MKNQYLYLRSIILIISSLSLCSITLPSVKKEKKATPNVVIIFMDDMGYGDVECYGGFPYHTPNINKLAAEGVRFTNFYAAQAVCTASRAALLTGCYPNRIGMHGALGHNAKIALNPDEETIAELLKNKGYKTGMVGKWHLGHKAPYLPLQNGFDEFFGLPYSNDMWPLADTTFYKAKYPPLPLLEGNETIRILKKLDDQSELTSLYTERAIRFIKKNKNNPFFLYFAHSMVHVPIAASDKFKGKSGAGLFGDVMEEVDWSVGEVMKALKENGIDKNTIVIFTSDNGPWLTFGNHAGNSGGLREGKGTAWDGGLKVPCIMRWPGNIAAGTICNNLSSTIDVLPTLLNITHANKPQHKIDGVDISSLLRGDSKTNPRDEFVYYYDKNSLKGIRKGEWKLVFPATSQTYKKSNAIGNDGHPGQYGSEEISLALYNLRTDPGEDRDVKDSHLDIVQQLTEIANKYRKTLGDDLTQNGGSEIRPAAKL